jgi:hypothetical protein
MMSQRSKQELLAAVHPRYLKANKAEKTKIIDEFVAATGYHRKYALRVLKRGPRRSKGKRKGRTTVYTGKVVEALETIWEICGRICSRRLHPYLPEMLKVLERHNEMHLDDETRRLLLQMSRATIDRCLQTARYKQPRGRSTTKPGSLLKAHIPIRTYTPWDEQRPGFMEVDLVAHCGGALPGSF